MTTSVTMALVHEWIDAYAGSEQVFETMARAFPDADLFALSAKPDVQLDLGGRRLTTTALDSSVLRDRRGLTLPMMPLAWRLLGRAKYDVVLSSHHAFAHSNRLADGGVHICYVHTPARYLWNTEIDDRGGHWALAPARAGLRSVDLRASQRVTSYIANSSAVAKRIEENWGRTATVIHPPVRVAYFAEQTERQHVTTDEPFVLGVGRWIPYKNLHMVIEAADRAGMPVKIAGRGPDGARIRAAAAQAKVPVELIWNPSHEHLRELYQRASCLVFPTVEDFGIVPVEAQGAGTPVVAPAMGGACDTVVHGKTGVLVDEDSASAVGYADAIVSAYGMNAADCMENARRFDAPVFVRSLCEHVDSVVGAGVVR